MGSFGERLRREREMRGITLQEIAESTKISRRHLESLEKEDFDSLPGGIFNKGFVRAYARYLGIDEEQAVADFSTASNEQPEPQDRFPLEIHDQPDPTMNPRRSSLPLILALLALLAVLAVFWARNRNRVPENSDNTAAPTTSPSRTPATPSPVPPRETPSPSPEAATPAEQVSPSAATASPSQAQAFATKPPTPERTFSVVVIAKEDAWVQLKTDGRTVFSRTLRAGQQQSVRAGSRVELTTGNAGGVDVTFNGKALGAIGNESQVRTLTFTPAGLVQ
jgi:cytoskeleton protein RodZ